MKDTFDLHEVADLFQAALDLPPEDRVSFLARECRDRPKLHAEALRMLEADGKAGRFLERSLRTCLNTAESPECIGRWKVLELIGEGGLGIVYRASCDADGVTLQAAVKVLRAGFNTGIFHERFIQERRILSRLDHPYIARLIDAGVDSHGNSFLSTEFIAGRPLDHYVDESKPSLRERLDLFTRICAAVQYVHANGVVHGDIKPSNVMVKQDGTPKLLDFGTARLIGLSVVSGAGTLSMLIMTPGYASPEQLAGLGPSAPGDVYALGCVLRDLLANSTAAPDLCAIRDKCLSPSAGDRYPSAAELAAEVKRYAGHFPVRARPASGWYVARKFFRRNRISCALATLAVVSLLAGCLVWRYNARRADRYASQHRSVVAHLVRDQPAAATPESDQRDAFTGGVREAIAQMEALNPPPLDELSSAWRRLSYTQAVRGQTPHSVESIGRSIEYARRNRAAADTPAAGAQLAESLLYSSLLHTRRGNPRKAGAAANEANRLIDKLPDSKRSIFEKKPEYFHALSADARHRARAADVSGGRDILLRGLEQSRSLNKSIQLRMLLDLASFERKAGNIPQAQSYCREAKALDLANSRLDNVCGPESKDHDKVGAQLAQKESLLEKRLVQDPESFSDRRQLAQLKLQRARVAAESVDTARAARFIAEARALTQALLDADPQNRRLRRISADIEHAAARIGEKAADYANYPDEGLQAVR